jgi:hypothetical protein
LTGCYFGWTSIRNRYFSWGPWRQPSPIDGSRTRRCHHTMIGQASELFPGVTWNPEFYGQGNPWFADVIAYAINEGRVTSDSIEDEEGKVVWRVRDLTPLQRFNTV